MKSLAVACCFAALSVPLSATAAFDGTVVGHIGQRYLDADDWAPTERQLQFGVAADFAFGEAPVFLSPALQVSVDTEEPGADEFTMAVSTLSASIRFKPRQGTARPYLGLGIASVGASLEADTATSSLDDDDQSFGWLLQAGLEVHPVRHFVLGLNIDYLDGTKLEFDEFAFEADVNGPSITAYFGYSW